MAGPLRPCPACGRHYGDEAACPFCGSTAFRAPAMPAWLEREHRPAPKYGGPPLRRAFPWLLLALIAAAITTAMVSLLR